MNVTFAIDDALAAAAKVVAARRGTSVNALVRRALEEAVAVDARLADSGASGALEELVAYSLGERPRLAAMLALGIDDYGVLLRLLNAAGLPHPMVPLAERQAMAGAMVRALRER